MKKNIFLKLAFFCAPIFTILFFIPAFVAKAADNLISNPSFETADANGMPAGWLTDAWGSNTPTFTYQTEGYDGTRSAYVNLASRKGGDAKWYFDPVAVLPDSEYAFSDYYKSNIQSRIVVMSLDAQGNASYFNVGAVASSSAWKKAAFSFKTLANTSKISVFHLIQRNGWLQIDNVSLIKVEPAPIVDFVPNNSMENISITNANLPADWKRAKWGDNKPTYAYAKNGHDGQRSVKVTMTNYVSGDAKWIYTPQALERGKDYKFSAWFKTNTIPHVVAWFTKDDGSEDYFGMPDPEPSGTGWQFYSDVFNVPNDVKAVSVFFYLSNNGWVQTDDYHITPYQYAGFDQGVVSLVFDDGFERNASSALPILDLYNFKATQCATTQFVEDFPEQISTIKYFADNGHEICSHSATHPFLASLDTTLLDYELTHSQDYLKQVSGQTVLDFASPYGNYNAYVIEAIKKYYSSHRTVNEGFNSKDNFDPYRLRVQNVGLTTTLAEFNEWINKAKTEKVWLILVYHVVGPDSPGEFDSLQTDFNNQMQLLSTSGVEVMRWDKALETIKTQA